MTNAENFFKEISITQAANGRLYATIILPYPVREDDLEEAATEFTREAFRAMNDHLAEYDVLRKIKHLVDPIIRLRNSVNEGGYVTNVNFAEYREDNE